MTHSFFYWYITDYSGKGFDVNQGSPFPPAVPSRMGINLCLSVKSVRQKRVKKNPKDYLLFFILYIPTDQDTSSLTPNAHLQEYDSPLSLNSQ